MHTDNMALLILNPTILNKNLILHIKNLDKEKINLDSFIRNSYLNQDNNDRVMI